MTPHRGHVCSCFCQHPPLPEDVTHEALEAAIRTALDELFSGPPVIAPNGVVIDGANQELLAGTTVVGHITAKVMEVLRA